MLTLAEVSVAWTHLEQPAHRRSVSPIDGKMLGEVSAEELILLALATPSTTTGGRPVRTSVILAQGDEVMYGDEEE